MASKKPFESLATGWQIPRNQTLTLTLSSPLYASLEPTAIATLTPTSGLVQPPIATLDVDGNGQYDALTDGLLMLRYLFGLRGSMLGAGAIGGGAQRTVPQVEAYIQSLMP